MKLKIDKYGFIKTDKEKEGKFKSHRCPFSVAARSDSHIPPGSCNIRCIRCGVPKIHITICGVEYQVDLEDFIDERWRKENLYCEERAVNKPRD